MGATEGTAESAASAVAVGNAPTDTADGAVDGTYIAHIDAATPPSPDLWVDATDGTTGSAASAAAVSFVSSDAVPLPTEQADLHDDDDSGNVHSATVARDSRKRKYSPAKLARRQARIAQQDADSLASGGLGPGVP